MYCTGTICALAEMCGVFQLLVLSTPRHTGVHVARYGRLAPAVWRCTRHPQKAEQASKMLQDVCGVLGEFLSVSRQRQPVQLHQVGCSGFSSRSSPKKGDRAVVAVWMTKCCKDGRIAS